jgi:hypothetical protein
MNDIRDDLRAIRQTQFAEKVDWIYEGTLFGLVCVICWVGYLCIR